MADKYEEQMEMFEDGGLKDEGGTVDPVSGNDVPSGSTQSEVRDDIPAQLSEGEFVLPADVVRYIGLENLMELRNKAKQGLAQMEAMGQMGNSEEATMPDTADMEVDIDAMIDEFDPNDPELLSFAPGGYVAPSLTSPSSMQGGSAQGMIQPPQQGIQAPAYQAPGVPTGQQLLGGSSPVVYGNQEYIGPNNEIINITTVNGNPIQPVPTGYRPYNRATESPVSPVVEKPKVIEDTRNSGLDDREAENQRQADYDTFTNTMSDLASLSKNESFKDAWGKSVHNPKNKQTLGSVLSTNIVGNVMDDISMNTMANEEVESIAENLGIDLAPHTNKFSLFGLNKYDKESFVAEAKAVNAISESLGIDAKDLSRTNIDVNKDGKISAEEARAVEEDLFMTDEITDEEIDALTANDRDGRSDTDTSPETGPSSGTSPGRPGGESGERGGPSDNDGVGPDGTDAGDAADTSANTGGPSSGGTTSSGSPTAGGDQDFAKGGSVVDQTERALKASRRKSKK